MKLTKPAEVGVLGVVVQDFRRFEGLEARRVLVGVMADGEADGEREGVVRCLWRVVDGEAVGEYASVASGLKRSDEAVK